MRETQTHIKGQHTLSDQELKKAKVSAQGKEFNTKMRRKGRKKRLTGWESYFLEAKTKVSLSLSVYLCCLQEISVLERSKRLSVILVGTQFISRNLHRRITIKFCISGAVYADCSIQTLVYYIYDVLSCKGERERDSKFATATIVLFTTPLLPFRPPECIIRFSNLKPFSQLFSLMFLYSFLIIR